MKHVLLICMLAAMCCLTAFAAPSAATLEIPAEYQLSSALPAGFAETYRALRAEAEALESELAAAKLNGLDQTPLYARLNAIRNELGVKETREFGSYPASLDEGGESCTSATVIGSLPYADAGNTCDNANDHEGTCGATGAPDVFYLYTPADDQQVTLTTCHTATDYDTKIYVIETSTGTVIACNDDALGAPFECDLNGLNRKSLIECLDLVGGETYCIAVDGFLDFCGSYLLTVEECVTTCAPCPAGALQEGEEDCHDGYVDHYNSGCNNVLENGGESPAWGGPFLTCGDVVCGTSGNFLTSGLNYRDTDWYLISLSQPTLLRWCVIAEFAPAAAIVDLLASGCDPVTVVVIDAGDNCTELCVEACLPAGRYALFVSTVVAAPCGSPYVASVECLPCDPPPNCIPEPALVQLNPAVVPLPYCECIFICPQIPTLVCVGPGLLPDQYPVLSVTPGCFPQDTECDVECPPAFPTSGGWFYDPATGSFYIRIFPLPGTGPGCICLCLDDILPVELNSFDAIAGDGAVTLNWSTASETDMDHFDVVRDGTTVARINAGNSPTGSSYTWTDNNLVNGRIYNYTLAAVDLGGSAQNLGSVEATPRASSANVSEYALHQNYPNPFNPETRITFDLAESGKTVLTVTNSLGQTVATLVNEELASGRHTVSFSARDLPSGLYFYRLTSGDFSAIRKMVLMK